MDSIERPVLVLRGARSDFLPVETCQAMAERNSWIRWREIPDASHYVHDDNPEAYAAELRAFLSDPP